MFSGIIEYLELHLPLDFAIAAISQINPYKIKCLMWLTLRPPHQILYF